jgi:hypothetical protein
MVPRKQRKVLQIVATGRSNIDFQNNTPEFITFKQTGPKIRTIKQIAWCVRVYTNFRKLIHC